MLEQFVRDDESDVIDRVTRLEFNNCMAHTLLRDTDAMSMAHSLEVRVPLIDHKLVEFVTTIPADLKLKNGQPKCLLTESLADVLRPEVIARKKQGFEMPVASWMRGALKPTLDEVFFIELTHTARIVRRVLCSTPLSRFSARRRRVYACVVSGNNGTLVERIY